MGSTVLAIDAAAVKSTSRSCLKTLAVFFKAAALLAVTALAAFSYLAAVAKASWGRCRAEKCVRVAVQRLLDGRFATRLEGGEVLATLAVAVFTIGLPRETLAVQFETF